MTPRALRRRALLIAGLLAALIALPLLTRQGFAAYERQQLRSAQVQGCRALLTGQTPWRLAGDSLTELDDLSASTNARLSGAAMNVADQLRRSAVNVPPGVVRVYALPLQRRDRWSFLGAPAVLAADMTLSGETNHSGPGEFPLWVDVPWRGGAFVSLAAAGLCGKGRLRFSLLLLSDSVGALSIEGDSPGVVRQVLQIRR